jgi:hypothetical protein
VALGFGLKLDVPGEWLDSGVLKRIPLRTDGAYKLNRTNVVPLLGEYEVAPHRSFPRLNAPQDCVAA